MDSDLLYGVVCGDAPILREVTLEAMDETRRSAIRKYYQVRAANAVRMAMLISSVGQS